MDPNATHEGPSRFGGIGPTNHSAELGQVVSADPVRMSYTVRTMRGRPLQGVPRIRYSPDDLTILPRGTSVVIRYDLGLPVIDGVLDLPAAEPESGGIPATGVDSQGSASSDPLTGSYRGPGEPSDLLPGDTLLANKSGARAGVLEGGVALLRGSGMAQVRAHVLNDLVEIISRNYRHVTDMGISEVKNADGRVNWSYRGASDQTNEAAGSEENWTIRWDLGSIGDLLNFELTTPQGQTLFRLHVDSNGRAEIFGLDGVVIQSGSRNNEPHISEHGGDSVDTVHGARTVSTGSDVTETTQGSHSMTVDGTHTQMAGVDWAVSAVRDVGVSAGRNMNVVATGEKTGTTALNVSSLGGNYETTVGQPSYPSANYLVRTFKGNMTFRSSLGGNFLVESALGELHSTTRRAILETMAPDSVILGGNALVAHVAKFEQLEILLRAMMTAFDSHIHTLGGAPTSSPTVPMTLTLGSLIAPIRSVRVGVGG